MEKTEEEKLIAKYLNGECSESERELVESWYDGFMPEPQTPLTDADWQEDIRSIIVTLENITRPVKHLGWQRILAAASVLLAFIIGGYVFLHQRSSVEQVAKIYREPIVPGGNKAILTLQNGNKMTLTGRHNGNIAMQGLTAVNKTGDGELVYSSAARTTAVTVAYNTITTPRGGQYHVVLADGTNVWLNAASSLTYPVTFSGNDRTVSMSGEAYFEVSHNAQKPFHVKSSNQEIEVLGTHFNINSYDDEPGVKTTLLQGSIRINGKRTLVPGQQSSLTKTGIEVYNVDTEQVTAWKNNKFIFDHEDIGGIMRMVARWYDVEVVYAGTITDEKFGGSVPRFTSVTKVLDILQTAGRVHFKIEGRRITVTK